MTLNKYRFLEALLVLRDRFTLEDIIRLTKLSKNTSATFLNRETRFVERCGKIETKQRGGQIALYRVKNKALPLLEKEINLLRIRNLPGTLIIDRVIHILNEKIKENRGKPQALIVLKELQKEVKDLTLSSD